MVVHEDGTPWSRDESRALLSVLALLLALDAGAALAHWILH